MILGAGLGRKYAYLVLPTVLMPRVVFAPLGGWFGVLIGGEVRLLRPANCANAHGFNIIDRRN